MAGGTGPVQNAMVAGLTEVTRDGDLTVADVRHVIESLQNVKGYTPTAGHRAIDNLLSARLISGEQAAVLHDLVGVVAGERSYEKGGSHVYDLTNPADVRALIRASPQLDNLADTLHDDTRCGAAAALNGMLLAGDPTSAARAIAGYATEHNPDWQAVFPAAAKAVRALESGKLTPTQAAELQEMLFQMTIAGDPIAIKTTSGAVAAIPAGADDGLSASGMAALLAGLRSHGAFQNVSVTCDCVEHRGSPHWTVSIVDSAGHPARADSWPGPDGCAVAEDSAGRGDLHGDRAWVSTVTLRNGTDGKVSYDITSPEVEGAAGGRFLRWGDSVLGNGTPSFAREVLLFDRASGSLLSSVR